MTNIAQAALRRVIEQYTKNVRFCLVCNYVGKIIPALQSRCTRFRFAPLRYHIINISEEQIRSRLNYVVENESIRIQDDGMAALLKLSCGDMRRALNILQVIRNLFQVCTFISSSHEYNTRCYLRNYRIS
jgi:replication factor C subunit 3/5